MSKNTESMNKLTLARKAGKGGGGSSVTVINNLDSTSATAALSANMGHSLGESVESIDKSLLAGTQHFYFDEKDGVYGYNTDEERGAETFHPFSAGGGPEKYFYEEREITATGLITFECGFYPKKVFLERFTSKTATSLNQINIYDSENGGSKIYYGGSSGFTSVAMPNTSTNDIRNISGEGVITYSADSSSYKFFKVTAIG